MTSRHDISVTDPEFVLKKRRGQNAEGLGATKGGIMRCPLNLAMFTCMFITGDLLA